MQKLKELTNPMRGRYKSSPFLNNELGLQEKLSKSPLAKKAKEQLRKAHGRKTGNNKSKSQRQGKWH